MSLQDEGIVNSESAKFKSNASRSSKRMPSKEGPSDIAPIHQLPGAAFLTIEYPGYIKNHEKALKSIGGTEYIARSVADEKVPLELYLRPESRYSHPIHGYFVQSPNLLLKTTVKRRKTDPTEVITTHTIVGRIERTCRYRLMADFQYNPNKNDPIPRIREAIDKMDLQAMKAFDPACEPPVGEDGGIGAMPPPLFSRLEIPQDYFYRDNPTMKKEVKTADDGSKYVETKSQYKWMKGVATTIKFADPVVPSRPTAEALDMHKSRMRKTDPYNSTLARVTELFRQRPVWSRKALINHVAPESVKMVINNSLVMYMTSYAFMDGPWRDLQIRYGYDPRTDPEARMYQQISFRLDKIKETLRARAADGEITHHRPPNGTSHLFDGVHIDLDMVSFQLVDVTLPLLRHLIEARENDRASADKDDGWFPNWQWTLLRQCLRQCYMELAEGKKPKMVQLIENSNDPAVKIVAEGEQILARAKAGGDFQEDMASTVDDVGEDIDEDIDDRAREHLSNVDAMEGVE